jgi:hypothetical protein
MEGISLKDECFQITTHPHSIFKLVVFKFWARHNKNMKQCKTKLRPDEHIIYKSYTDDAKKLRKKVIKRVEEKYKTWAFNNNSMIVLPQDTTEADILNIVKEEI